MVDGWDYIVVGAGSAGAAVASRLSEDPSATVLVLEAGPDWSASGLPDNLRSATGLFTWDAYTVMPQYYWQGLAASSRPERTSARYLRGRGMGGSSTINGCYAIRPPLSEFDDWAASGCVGWSANEVLPHLMALENDLDFGDRPWHGDAGPIPITRLPEAGWGTVDRAFVEGMQKLGHRWVSDHNSPDACGVMPFGANIIDGARVTSFDGYLLPALTRPNLTVRGDALVDRVLLGGTRAIGVRSRIAGEWREVAGSNVILCAGAPLSPAILQRSGIGPSTVLARAGIAPVLDLPVGQGLQDHHGIILGLEFDGPCHSSAAGQRASVLNRWSTGHPSTGIGDVMAAAINASPQPDAPGQRPPSILGVLNQVFSRGRVEITTADPTANPRMDLNLLSDERDRVRFHALVEHLAELLRTDSFADVRAVRDVHGDEVDFHRDPARSDAWANRVVQDTAHVSCTCPMGAPDAPGTVVDPNGRVLGTEHLWVADASIFPTVPRANTNLTAVMVGEKIAAGIRALAANE